LNGFGAKAYSKLGVETDVLTADPHRLVLILFDGALSAIQRAKGLLSQRRIVEKCLAISQAMRIVDSGLCSSVDPTVAPEFAGRLISLYKYILVCLVQGNLHNDVKPLDEAATLLGGLRDAWRTIGPSAAASRIDIPSPPEALAPGTAARALRAYRA